MLGNEKAPPPPSTMCASGNVVSLNDWRHADVIATAEALLAEARSGRMTGFAYVAQINGRDRPLCITGAYTRDSISLRGLVCMLYEFCLSRFR